MGSVLQMVRHIYCFVLYALCYLNAELYCQSTGNYFDVTSARDLNIVGLSVHTFSNLREVKVCNDVVDFQSSILTQLVLSSVRSSQNLEAMMGLKQMQVHGHLFRL